MSEVLNYYKILGHTRNLIIPFINVIILRVFLVNKYPSIHFVPLYPYQDCRRPGPSILFSKYDLYIYLYVSIYKLFCYFYLWSRNYDHLSCYYGCYDCTFHENDENQFPSCNVAPTPHGFFFMTLTFLVFIFISRPSHCLTYQLCSSPLRVTWERGHMEISFSETYLYSVFLLSRALSGVLCLFAGTIRWWRLVNWWHITSSLMLQSRLWGK